MHQEDALDKAGCLAQCPFCSSRQLMLSWGSFARPYTQFLPWSFVQTFPLFTPARAWFSQSLLRKSHVVLLSTCHFIST